MTRATRAVLFAGALLGAALVGCGDEVIDTIPGGTGGGTTSGSGGAGGGDACSIFDDDDASLGTLEIVFRNDTMQTVYLPTLCGRPTFTFRPEDGAADNEAYLQPDTCLQTCEDLQTEGQIACGACQATTVEIPAGGTFTYEWNGFYLQSGGMAAACWLDGEDGGACSIQLAAEAGTYRASASAFAACEQGGAPCECEGQECVGSPTGMEALSDTGAASFPGDGTLEVVFGPCAFGCPG